MISVDKPALRRHFRRVRAAIPRPYRQAAGRNAWRLLLRHGVALRGQRWGVYLSVASEFDLSPLIARLRRMGRDVSVPVLPRQSARPLRFAPLGQATRMRPNRYGIAEPVCRQPHPARQLDVLLLPLVAFDLQGTRLGMGGGYYDATLAYLRHRSVWRKPRLIGVAYDCQQATALPRDPWDCPLDAILTETRFLWLPARARGAK
jgi:5-formyltetrahydrofolate cyclo-ligase